MGIIGGLHKTNSAIPAHKGFVPFFFAFEKKLKIITPKSSLVNAAEWMYMILIVTSKIRHSGEVLQPSCIESMTAR